MWYSLTGVLNPLLVADVINYVTSQINKGSKEPLTLYISAVAISGHDEEALRLYGFLKAIPNRVETVAYGILDTDALLVFLAGDKRTALTHAQFELYEQYFNMAPTVEAPLHTHQTTIKIFKAIEGHMIDIIAQETNKDRRTIKRLMHTGKTFSAEEAQKFGIAHTVSDVFPIFVPVPPSPTNEPVKN